MSLAVTEREAFFAQVNLQFMKFAIPLSVCRVKAKGVRVLTIRDGPLHCPFDVVRIVRSLSTGAVGENNHGIEISLIWPQTSSRGSGIEGNVV